MSSVVVTGVGVGLGRAILERLSDDGWTVVGIEIDPTTAKSARAWLGQRSRPGAVVTQRRSMSSSTLAISPSSWRPFSGG